MHLIKLGGGLWNFVGGILLLMLLRQTRGASIQVFQEDSAQDSLQQLLESESLLTSHNRMRVLRQIVEDVDMTQIKASGDRSSLSWESVEEPRRDSQADAITTDSDVPKEISTSGGLSEKGYRGKTRKVTPLTKGATGPKAKSSFSTPVAKKDKENTAKLLIASDDLPNRDLNINTQDESGRLSYQIPLPYGGRGINFDLSSRTKTLDVFLANSGQKAHRRKPALDSVRVSKYRVKREEVEDDDDDDEDEDKKNHDKNGGKDTKSDESIDNEETKFPNNLLTQQAVILQRLTSALEKVVKELTFLRQKFSLRLIKITDAQDFNQMPHVLEDFNVTEKSPMFIIVGGVKMNAPNLPEIPTSTVEPDNELQRPGETTPLPVHTTSTTEIITDEDIVPSTVKPVHELPGDQVPVSSKPIVESPVLPETESPITENPLVNVSSTENHDIPSTEKPLVSSTEMPVNENTATEKHEPDSTGTESDFQISMTTLKTLNSEEFPATPDSGSPVHSVNEESQVAMVRNKRNANKEFNIDVTAELPSASDQITVAQATRGYVPLIGKSFDESGVTSAHDDLAVSLNENADAKVTHITINESGEEPLVAVADIGKTNTDSIGESQRVEKVSDDLLTGQVHELTSVASNEHLIGQSQEKPSDVSLAINKNIEKSEETENLPAIVLKELPDADTGLPFLGREKETINSQGLSISTTGVEPNEAEIALKADDGNVLIKSPLDISITLNSPASVGDIGEQGQTTVERDSELMSETQESKIKGVSALSIQDISAGEVESEKNPQDIDISVSSTLINPVVPAKVDAENTNSDATGELGSSVDLSSSSTNSVGQGQKILAKEEAAPGVVEPIRVNVESLDNSVQSKEDQSQAPGIVEPIRVNVESLDNSVQSKDQSHLVSDIGDVSIKESEPLGILDAHEDSNGDSVSAEEEESNEEKSNDLNSKEGIKIAIADSSSQVTVQSSTAALNHYESEKTSSNAAVTSQGENTSDILIHKGDDLGNENGGESSAVGLSLSPIENVSIIGELTEESPENNEKVAIGHEKESSNDREAQVTLLTDEKKYLNNENVDLISNNIAKPGDSELPVEFIPNKLNNGPAVLSVHKDNLSDENKAVGIASVSYGVVDNASEENGAQASELNTKSATASIENSVNTLEIKKTEMNEDNKEESMASFAQETVDTSQAAIPISLNTNSVGQKVNQVVKELDDKESTGGDSLETFKDSPTIAIQGNVDDSNAEQLSTKQTGEIGESLLVANGVDLETTKEGSVSSQENENVAGEIETLQENNPSETLAQDGSNPSQEVGSVTELVNKGHPVLIANSQLSSNGPTDVSTVDIQGNIANVEQLNNLQTGESLESHDLASGIFVEAQKESGTPEISEHNDWTISKDKGHLSSETSEAVSQFEDGNGKIQKTQAEDQSLGYIQNISAANDDSQSKIITEVDTPVGIAPVLNGADDSNTASLTASDNSNAHASQASETFAESSQASETYAESSQASETYAESSQASETSAESSQASETSAESSQASETSAEASETSAESFEESDTSAESSESSETSEKASVISAASQNYADSTIVGSEKLEIKSQASTSASENSIAQSQTSEIASANVKADSQKTSELVSDNIEVESQKTSGSQNVETESQKTSAIASSNVEEESQKTSEMTSENVEAQSQQTSEMATENDDTESQKTSAIAFQNNEAESQQTSEMASENVEAKWQKTSENVEAESQKTSVVASANGKAESQKTSENVKAESQQASENFEAESQQASENIGAAWLQPSENVEAESQLTSEMASENIEAESQKSSGMVSENDDTELQNTSAIASENVEAQSQLTSEMASENIEAQSQKTSVVASANVETESQQTSEMASENVKVDSQQASENFEAESQQSSETVGATWQQTSKNVVAESQQTSEMASANAEAESQKSSGMVSENDDTESQKTSAIAFENNEAQLQQTSDMAFENVEAQSQKTSVVASANVKTESQKTSENVEAELQLTSGMVSENDDAESQKTSENVKAGSQQASENFEAESQQASENVEAESHQESENVAAAWQKTSENDAESQQTSEIEAESQKPSEIVKAESQQVSENFEAESQQASENFETESHQASENVAAESQKLSGMVSENDDAESQKTSAIASENYEAQSQQTSDMASENVEAQSQKTSVVASANVKAESQQTSEMASENVEAESQKTSENVKAESQQSSENFEAESQQSSENFEAESQQASENVEAESHQASENVGAAWQKTSENVGAESQKTSAIASENYEAQSQQASDMASENYEAQSQQTSDMASENVEAQSQKTSVVASANIEAESQQTSEMASENVEAESQQTSDMASENVEAQSQKTSVVASANVKAESQQTSEMASENVEAESQKTSENVEAESLQASENFVAESQQAAENVEAESHQESENVVAAWQQTSENGAESQQTSEIEAESQKTSEIVTAESQQASENFEAESQQASHMASENYEAQSQQTSDMASENYEAQSQQTSDMASENVEAQSQKTSVVASANIEAESQQTSEMASENVKAESQQASENFEAESQQASESVEAESQQASENFEAESQQASENVEAESHQASENVGAAWQKTSENVNAESHQASENFEAESQQAAENVEAESHQASENVGAVWQQTSENDAESQQTSEIKAESQKTSGIVKAESQQASENFEAESQQASENFEAESHQASENVGAAWQQTSENVEAQSQKTSAIASANVKAESQESSEMESENHETESQNTSGMVSENDDAESQKTSAIASENYDAQSQQTSEMASENVEAQSQKTSVVASANMESESQQTSEMASENVEAESQQTSEIEAESQQTSEIEAESQKTSEIVKAESQQASENFEAESQHASENVEAESHQASENVVAAWQQTSENIEAQSQKTSAIASANVKAESQESSEMESENHETESQNTSGIASENFESESKKSSGTVSMNSEAASQTAEIFKNSESELKNTGSDSKISETLGSIYAPSASASVPVSAPFVAGSGHLKQPGIPDLPGYEDWLPSEESETSDSTSGNNEGESENNGGGLENSEGELGNIGGGSESNEGGSENNEGGSENSEESSENNEESSENNEESSVNNEEGTENNEESSENNEESSVNNEEGSENNEEGSENNEGGSENNEGGSENNEGGSENNEEGSENNEGGSENNEGGSENNEGGSENNEEGSENNEGGLENNQGGLENNQGGLENNQGGLENNQGGLENNEGGLENNQVGSETGDLTSDITEIETNVSAFDNSSLESETSAAESQNSGQSSEITEAESANSGASSEKFSSDSETDGSEPFGLPSDTSAPASAPSVPSLAPSSTSDIEGVDHVEISKDQAIGSVGHTGLDSGISLKEIIPVVDSSGGIAPVSFLVHPDTAPLVANDNTKIVDQSEKTQSEGQLVIVGDEKVQKDVSALDIANESGLKDSDDTFTSKLVKKPLDSIKTVSLEVDASNSNEESLTDVDSFAENGSVKVQPFQDKTEAGVESEKVQDTSKMVTKSDETVNQESVSTLDATNESNSKDSDTSAEDETIKVQPGLEVGVSIDETKEVGSVGDISNIKPQLHADTTQNSDSTVSQAAPAESANEANSDTIENQNLESNIDSVLVDDKLPAVANDDSAKISGTGEITVTLVKKPLDSDESSSVISDTDTKQVGSDSIDLSGNDTFISHAGDDSSAAESSNPEKVDLSEAQDTKLLNTEQSEIIDNPKHPDGGLSLSVAVAAPVVVEEESAIVNEPSLDSGLGNVSGADVISKTSENEETKEEKENINPQVSTSNLGLVSGVNLEENLDSDKLSSEVADTNLEGKEKVPISQSLLVKGTDLVSSIKLEENVDAVNTQDTKETENESISSQIPSVQDSDLILSVNSEENLGTKPLAVGNSDSILIDTNEPEFLEPVVPNEKEIENEKQNTLSIPVFAVPNSTSNGDKIESVSEPELNVESGPQVSNNPSDSITFLTNINESDKNVEENEKVTSVKHPSAEVTTEDEEEITGSAQLLNQSENEENSNKESLLNQENSAAELETQQVEAQSPSLSSTGGVISPVSVPHPLFNRPATDPVHGIPQYLEYHRPSMLNKENAAQLFMAPEGYTDPNPGKVIIQTHPSYIDQDFYHVMKPSWADTYLSTVLSDAKRRRILDHYVPLPLANFNMERK